MSGGRPNRGSLKGHVHNGRLVLDEPTELPEGEVIELVPVDEVLADGGDLLDGEEPERLHEALRESIAQMKRGEMKDAARCSPNCARVDEP